MSSRQRTDKERKMELKFLTKTVELGEKKFKVAVDRDIACDAFEQFPNLIEYLMKKEVKNRKENDADFFLNALKNKELKQLFNMEKQISELIGFALPLMLDKAGDSSDADEIIQYAKDNNAEQIFNNGMLEFIIQGFTPRELAVPKIKFSMK